MRKALNYRKLVDGREALKTDLQWHQNGGPDFLFKGRAQIVCVRYKDSATGWATIRELIQAGPYHYVSM